MTIRLECPRCGQPNEVERLERGADDFCSNCDYPLYWAVLEDSVAETAYSGAGILDPSFRRLPGTAGRLDLVGEPCPRCSERNSPGAKFCSRCGLDLHPAPAPPPEPVARPVPVAVAEVFEQPKPDHLLLLIAVTALVLAIIVLGGILLDVGWLALTVVSLVAALVGLAAIASYWRSRHDDDDRS